MNIIEFNIPKIINLCKLYKVKTLAVFGSVLTERFNESSDVDFAFTFNNDVNYSNYSDNFFGLYEGLKRLFNREIDLVDESAIKNQYFKEELEDTKHSIWIAK